MKKQIRRTEFCDVYVAGAGIAGITAAISAAESQSRVILSSAAALFSGSSFHPGTWGRGVVTPEDEADEKDLMQTIKEVGCGMADEGLVRVFVKGMRPTLSWLRGLGLPLMEAKDKNQKDFIPCFDHKHRQWNGIVAKEARRVLAELLNEKKILQRPFQRLVDIQVNDGKITGVLVENRHGELELIGCGALVLATGGFSGLYEKHLTTDDIQGFGQALALEHGAQLVNMEFLQMMPGYVSPCRNTVFNERTFRYVNFPTDCKKEYLEQRGTYGPFTSRFESRAVDLAISKAGENGMDITYSKELKEQMPEFIQTYFTWLKEEKGLTIDDPVRISMFAHASNGGISINSTGGTKIPGLFACGEVTGGMHGADRIGGLSTVNGFVFGRKAGYAAAEYSKTHTDSGNAAMDVELFGIQNRSEFEREWKSIMSKAAFLIRNGSELKHAIWKLDHIRQSIRTREEKNIHEAVEAQSFLLRLKLAEGILKAQLLRCESRGSHFRADYPMQNRTMKKKIIIGKRGDAVAVDWEQEV